MRIYTLEKAGLQSDNDGNVLMNITEQIVLTDDTLKKYPYYVSKAEEMRPDLVVQGMFGNTEYIDEIMTINNIVDSWSLTEGTLLWYCDVENLNNIRKSPKTETSIDIISKLVDPNSERKIDYNRETGEGVFPSIKPTTLKQISVDTTNNTIKVINRLK